MFVHHGRASRYYAQVRIYTPEVVPNGHGWTWTSREYILTYHLRYLDIPRLLSWLSARQYAPEGGFAGRTNKLVDGCYSHWVGGCWPLVQACLDGPSLQVPGHEIPIAPSPSVGSLYSREGLIRYILCCCQDRTRRGGLRDKPSRYVRCNALSCLFMFLCASIHSNNLS